MIWECQESLILHVIRANKFLSFEFKILIYKQELGHSFRAKYSNMTAVKKVCAVYVRCSVLYLLKIRFIIASKMLQMCSRDMKSMLLISTVVRHLWSCSPAFGRPGNPEILYSVSHLQARASCHFFYIYINEQWHHRPVQGLTRLGLLCQLLRHQRLAAERQRHQLAEDVMTMRTSIFQQMSLCLVW